jgi:hypothetical protein
VGVEAVVMREDVHDVSGGGMAWDCRSHAVLRGSAAIQRMRPLWHAGHRSSGGAAAVDSAIWQVSVAGPECPAWVAAIKALTLIGQCQSSHLLGPGEDHVEVRDRQ